MNDYEKQSAIAKGAYMSREMDRDEIEIYNEYNFSNKIIALHRLYRDVVALQDNLRSVERRIDEARSNIPHQVLDLYDKQRMVQALGE